MNGLEELVHTAFDETKDLFAGINTSLTVMRKKAIWNALGYGTAFALATTQIGCDSAGSGPEEEPPVMETSYEQTIVSGSSEGAVAGQTVSLHGEAYGVLDNNDRVTPDTLISFYDGVPIDTVLRGRTIETTISPGAATQGDHTGKILAKVAYDGTLHEASDSFSFTLQEETGTAPVMESFSVNPDSGVVPLLVELTGDASHPSGQVEYRFDVDSDGVVDASSQDGIVSHTYDEVGEFTASAFAVHDGVSSDTLEQGVKVVETTRLPQFHPDVIDWSLVEDVRSAQSLEGLVSDGSLDRVEVVSGPATAMVKQDSLILESTPDGNGPYRVEVVASNGQGSTSTTVDGSIEPRTDLEGITVVSSESGQGVSSEVRVYSPSRELVAVSGSGSDGLVDRVQVRENYGSYVVQAREVVGGSAESFVRTVSVPGAVDGSDVSLDRVMHVVPYDRLDEIGLSPGQFAEMAKQGNFTQLTLEKTYFEDNAPSSDIVTHENVVVIPENPVTGDSMSQSEAEHLRDLINMYIPEAIGGRNPEAIVSQDEQYWWVDEFDNIRGEPGYRVVAVDDDVSGGIGSVETTDNVITSGYVLFNPRFFLASENNQKRGVREEIASVFMVDSDIRQEFKNYSIFANQTSLQDYTAADMKLLDLIDSPIPHGARYSDVLATDFYTQNQ